VFAAGPDTKVVRNMLPAPRKVRCSTAVTVLGAGQRLLSLDQMSPRTMVPYKVGAAVYSSHSALLQLLPSASPPHELTASCVAQGLIVRHQPVASKYSDQC
jgi:hypothetical protein